MQITPFFLNVGQGSEPAGLHK